jgi:hypothetical protein
MKEHLVDVYIENVLRILERLSRYKSQQASFVYRHPSHGWLLRPPGYQVAIESRVLEKTLRYLDALIEVDRSISRKRFVVKVQPLKKALKNRKTLLMLLRRFLLEELRERAERVAQARARISRRSKLVN